MKGILSLTLQSPQCPLYITTNLSLSQPCLELNEPDLDDESRKGRGGEDEIIWRERDEELSLRDFVPDGNGFELPRSKFTLLLVRCRKHVFTHFSLLVSFSMTHHHHQVKRADEERGC